jgi:MinD superfamily P-loop ATPase
MSTLTVCYAVKGGSGTTVTAAAIALADPGDSLLVDLDGELPATLGLPEPAGDGISDWCTTTAEASLLDVLTVEVNRTTRLLPRGRQPIESHQDRWKDLAAWLTTRPSHVIVDAGTRQPAAALTERADRTLLVTRPCYLALRRAVTTAHRPTGIVLVNEPGRALHRADVERAVGIPVVTQINLDPAVARAVDAGLLAARLPQRLQHAVTAAATTSTPSSAEQALDQWQHATAATTPDPPSPLGGIA